MKRGIGIFRPCDEPTFRLGRKQKHTWEAGPRLGRRAAAEKRAATPQRERVVVVFGRPGNDRRVSRGRMSYRVQFMRGNKVVGTATFPDLRLAILHVRDRDVFVAQYDATTAYVFNTASNRVVYTLRDTTGEFGSLVVDKGVARTVIEEEAAKDVPANEPKQTEKGGAVPRPSKRRPPSA